MQESLYKTWMQETVSDSRSKRQYQTGGAGVPISDSGCRSLYIRQRMQDTLYQTADVRVYIRQQMQETLYQTADA